MMKKGKTNYISETLTLIYVLAVIVFQSVIIYKINASNSMHMNNASSDMANWLSSQGEKALFVLLWLMLLGSIIMFIILLIRVIYTYFEKYRKNGDIFYEKE